MRWLLATLALWLSVPAAAQVGGRESLVRWPSTTSPLLFPVAEEDYLALTSPFGVRVSPTLRVLAHHDGIDVWAVRRAQVVAVADGWVAELWPPPDGYYRGHPTYGGMLRIAHGTGAETLYAHLSAVYVAWKQRVRRGQVIGRVGRTGLVTDEHLHFELRLGGTLVNPLLYLNLPGTN